MSTIRTSIQIFDGMSPAFRSMSTAINVVLNSFEALQTASHNVVDTSSIQTAREELAKAEVSFNSVEQHINEANQAQQKFNENIRKGQNAADGLVSKVKNVVSTFGAALGIKQILGLSDTLTLTKSRLDLMNDGLQTTAQLQNMIFASAERSRSSYIDTAQVVSKLGILAGGSFKNNREMIAFAEQMNKQFKIGGASIEEQTAAMYQLTQAMASGRLQGDEFRSIMENAPMLAQAIAKYMGKSMGELRKLSAEGVITADVIKNAMFASADETNKKFSELPMTWGQIWTSIQNKAIKVFDPILAKINKVANGKGFNKMVDGIINGIATIAAVASQLFNILSAVAGVIYDNWSWISPIVWGIVAAFAAYRIAALMSATATGIATFAKMAAVPVYALLTGATMADTAAQWNLNAAMYACPLTWIIILIIVLIALFFAAIAIINKFAGTSISAFGLIAGAFMVHIAFVANLFISLWNLLADIFTIFMNLLADVANFFANVFKDPIGSVYRLFYNMVDAVLGLIQSLASAIDTIFGSKLADSVKGWRDGLSGMVDSVFGKGDEVIAHMSADDLKIKGYDYKKAWDTGYNAGKKLDNLDIGKLLGGATNSLDALKLGDTLNGIYGNTTAMADSMSASSESLEYMRDLAEQEAVNRFTTAEIKVDMTNHNTVSSEMDLDGVVSYLEDKVYETMEVAAEGVHE